MNYFDNPKLDQVLANSNLAIFDMNGLIIDDEGVQLEAVNQMLKEYDIQISEDYWINECVGHKASEFLLRIMQENEVNPSLYTVDELGNKKNENYRSLVQENLKKLVRPGVFELIKYISEDTDKKLAVSTSASKKEVEIILGGLGIKDKFEVIVCGDEVKKGKPDPETYLKVSETTKIKPDTCLVFEDTSIGLQAATSAGMHCFSVPNKYTQKQDFSRADFVVSDLTPNAKIVL
ncbi:MAG: HAD family phosphatase [Gammaproteobacteria bacterium]|jgi:HAD superfamily hydrolase (TIGR01509 family)|nr:HAD family phosphatase [Gammaproteobacteria bacterium]MBT6049046.1 HAD family phosphatase [Candidatus Scalindua sp.]MBT5221766.1 HAD family phosphatase [Gammaproteobacteria bacterium]MBT5825156.1 HAD family phosphatase [Gammaproteobacteria bacterium]MBT6576582.1 HAD family phosphatase [Gammaproteobacteria bacterium]